MNRAAALPRLHVVTSDDVVRRAGFFGSAERALRAGGERLALHLRWRGSGAELYDLGARLSGVAADTGSALIVSRRVDVALAVGASGVQLGTGALPASAARRLLGAGAWIGRSLHRVEEVGRLESAADYAFLGAVYDTASHPGRGALGVSGLRSACAAAARPVFAIGGVRGERVAEVTAAGAYGVAVLGAVWDAEDPAEAVGSMLDSLESSL
ncbi:MAG: thiamine phosphate synthase [Gemmatimonadota bacterium]